MIKLNTLLAKVDHGTSMFNRMIGDYSGFFKNKQGMFEVLRRPSNREMAMQKMLVIWALLK